MTRRRHDPEELLKAQDRWQEFINASQSPNQVAVLCQPLSDHQPWSLSELSALVLRDAALRVLTMQGRGGRSPLLFSTDGSAQAALVTAASCLPSTDRGPEPSATEHAYSPESLLELLGSRGFAERLRRRWPHCPSCDQGLPWSAPGESCERCGAVLVERTTTTWNLRLEAIADRIKPAFLSYHAAALYFVGGSPENLFAHLTESGWPLTDPRSAPFEPGDGPAEPPVEHVADHFAGACRLLETCAGSSPARFFVVRDPALEFTFHCLAAALETVGEPIRYPPFQKELHPAAVHVDELLCDEHGSIWADGATADRPDTCPSCGRELTRRHLHRGHQLLEADSMLERWGPDVVRFMLLRHRNNVFGRLSSHGIRQNPVPVSEETFPGAERILTRLERRGRIVAELPDSMSTISTRSLSVSEHELHHHIHLTIQTADDALDDELSFARVCAAAFQLAKISTEAVDSCRPALVRQALETALRLLHPVAPVITESLWARLGHEESILAAGWPTFEPELARPYTVEVPVQVGNKVRARLRVRPGTPASELEELALSHPDVRAFIAGHEARRVTVVPDRVVNIALEQ